MYASLRGLLSKGIRNTESSCRIPKAWRLLILLHLPYTMSSKPAPVPGLLRLGLAGSPSRVNPGFKLERSLKGDMLPFDRGVAGGQGGSSASSDPAPARGARQPFVPEKFEPYVPEKFALAGLKLTFRCYFQEGVPESTLESSRKRHLLLLYHLEDDSCEIVEPEVRNNGMIPGRFLKRMKIPDVTPDTLRVGGNVEIFSRTLRLYACDDFTRVSGKVGGQPLSPEGRAAWQQCPRPHTLFFSPSPLTTTPPPPPPTPPFFPTPRNSLTTWASPRRQTRAWRRTRGRSPRR